MNDEFIDQVHQVLKEDPLASAEKITGKSYKEDVNTSMLGLLLHMDHTKRKGELLAKTDDLSHCCTFERFLTFMTNMGFEKVLEDKFEHHTWGDKLEEQVCQIWWNDERGILCWAESYGDNLNAAKFYGNCKLTDQKYTSSGGFHALPPVLARQDAYDKVWSAMARLAGFKRDLYETISHEAIAEKAGITVEEVQTAKDNKPELSEYFWCGDWHHEGIRHNITMIDEVGEWQREWVKRPFLWFVNYSETKDDNYDHKAITAERISRLPQNIQDLITPEED